MYALHVMDTAGSSHAANLSQHNQASKCLLVMCGLPGAGKTTLANRLQQVFTQRTVTQARSVHPVCSAQKCALHSVPGLLQAGRNAQQFALTKLNIQQVAGASFLYLLPGCCLSLSCHVQLDGKVWKAFNSSQMHGK